MAINFFSLGKFYGIDSLVELLIILVAISISYYSYKIYRIIKDKNYFLFSLSFLSIAISFILKILSNLTILHQVKITTLNLVITITKASQYMELINFISFISYKTLNLIGFLILFFIVTRTKGKEKILLFIYLSITTVFFSIYFNFIFYMTLIFILSFITTRFYYNYKKIQSLNSLLVFLGFFLISLSSFIFIFSEANSNIYLVGEFVRLFGFLALLLNQIKLKNVEQKKDKT